MNITLTPDLDQALAESARKLGTTPERLAIESLRERFVPTGEQAPPSPQQETLADFLHEHLGVLHSAETIAGGARMSEKSAEQFTAGLTSRRRQERS